MVVRPVRGRLCLTRQLDHARAAARIAASWGNRRFACPEPRASVLLATEQHDAGWVEWEKRPQLRPDTRRPYDFLNIPQVVHMAVYSQGVAIARAMDPYAGLLVSLHGTGLYNGRWGHLPHLPVRPTDPGCEERIPRFLAEQAAVQAELKAALQPDEDWLWTNYRWLQAWDALSLMLCMFDPTDGREILLGTMPEGPGGAEAPMVMRGVGPETWSISPWPFPGDRLELAWPVRYVADQPYESDEAFQAAFDAATLEEQRVTLIPA